jgi:hypothetical protein
MSLCGIKIACESVPLDDSDYDIQESIWYKAVRQGVSTKNLYTDSQMNIDEFYVLLTKTKEKL